MKELTKNNEHHSTYGRVSNKRLRRTTSRGDRRKKALAAKIEKKKRMFPQGEAHLYIVSNFGNTIVTLTDPYGNVACWSSGGTSGFKNTKKKTPYAAQAAMRSLIKMATLLGVREITVILSGVGWARQSAVWSLAGSNLKIKKIIDVTPVPRNGCRPRKRRKIRTRTKREPRQRVRGLVPLKRNIMKRFLKRGRILKRFLIKKKKR